METAFGEVGIAGGTHVDPGVQTDTIPGLVDGGSYTVYVALVSDDLHTLVDVGNAYSRATVSFSVEPADGSSDTISVGDSQGSAGETAAVPITISDVSGAAEAVVGIDLTVTYDPAILTQVSEGAVTTAAARGLIVAAWSIEQNIATPGELNTSYRERPRTR